MARGVNARLDQQRIAWMLAHQELWRGYGGPWDTRSRAIFAALQDAGLYARTTWFGNVDIGGLVVLARKRRREIAAGEPTETDFEPVYQVAV